MKGSLICRASCKILSQIGPAPSEFAVLRPMSPEDNFGANNYTSEDLF